MGAFLASGGPINWLPENTSTYGGQIDHLFWLITFLVTVAFVGTQAVMIYSLFKFRARKEGEKSHFSHGSHKLEVSWTFITGAILFFLALYQWSAWATAKIDMPSEDEAVVVQVFAKQFEWNFRYASEADTFGYEEICPFDTNKLHVPVDEPVLLKMRTLDVLHSLFLPHLRFKQDLVPGLTIRGWFQATKTTAVARAERCLAPWEAEKAAIESALADRASESSRKKLTAASDELAEKVAAFEALDAASDRQKAAEEITVVCEKVVAAATAALADAEKRVTADPKYGRNDLEPVREGKRALARAVKLGLRWDFEIACAELCGIGHHEMRARLIVHSKEGFAAWRKETIASYEQGVSQGEIWSQWDRAAWTEKNETEESKGGEAAHHE